MEGHLEDDARGGGDPETLFIRKDLIIKKGIDGLSFSLAKLRRLLIMNKHTLNR